MADTPSPEAHSTKEACAGDAPVAAEPPRDADTAQDIVRSAFEAGVRQVRPTRRAIPCGKEHTEDHAQRERALAYVQEMVLTRLRERAVLPVKDDALHLLKLGMVESVLRLEQGKNDAAVASASQAVRLLLESVLDSESPSTGGALLDMLAQLYEEAGGDDALRATIQLAATQMGSLFKALREMMEEVLGDMSAAAAGTPPATGAPGRQWTPHTIGKSVATSAAAVVGAPIAVAGYALGALVGGLVWLPVVAAERLAASLSCSRAAATSAVEPDAPPAVEADAAAPTAALVAVDAPAAPAPGLGDAAATASSDTA